jgi:hypothetical protein
MKTLSLITNLIVAPFAFTYGMACGLVTTRVRRTWYGTRITQKFPLMGKSTLRVIPVIFGRIVNYRFSGRRSFGFTRWI